MKIHLLLENEDKDTATNLYSFFHSATGGSASSEDITPNITVDDVLKIDPLGEVDFEMILYHAPGETNDQIIAWLPKQRVLFPADNIYKVLEFILFDLTKDRTNHS